MQPTRPTCQHAPNTWSIQRGAVVTRAIFPKTLTIDDPYLVLEGESLGVIMSLNSGPFLTTAVVFNIKPRYGATRLYAGTFHILEAHFKVQCIIINSWWKCETLTRHIGHGHSIVFCYWQFYQVYNGSVRIYGLHIVLSPSTVPRQPVLVREPKPWIWLNLVLSDNVFFFVIYCSLGVCDNFKEGAKWKALSIFNY